MAKLRIRSIHRALARSIADALRAEGHEVSVDRSLGHHGTLRLGPGFDRAAQRGLLESIASFELDVEEVDSLDVDAELDLSCESARESFSELAVEVRLDDPYDRRAARALLDRFEAQSVKFSSEGRPLRSELRHGGAPSLLVRGLRWLFERRGFVLEESILPSLEAHQIQLDLVRPEVASRPARERFGIELESDDLIAASGLAARLRELGFRVEIPPYEEILWQMEPRRSFALEPGPLVAHGLDEELSLVAREVRAFLQARGVDLESHPFLERPDRPARRLGPASRAIDRLVLPLGAHARGELRAYGGAPHARFRVTVRSDDALRSEPVLALLRELGFADPRHEHSPAPSVGFRVCCNSLRSEAASLHAALCDRLRAQIGEQLGHEPPAPEHRDSRASDDVVIDIPWRVLADDDPRAALLRHRRSFPVTVFGRLGARTKLRAALEAAGYRVDAPREQPALALRFGEQALRFGAAPTVIAQEVARICADELGFEPKLDASFAADDNDIFVMLPAHLEVDDDPEPGVPCDESERGLPIRSREPKKALEPPVAARLEALRAELARPAARERIPRSFVERDESMLRIGECELERVTNAPHALAPRLDDFRHYCVDSETAELLLYVARAVELGEPCLLEGGTSSAKTSVALYLAALLGQPVVRVNLHGHTDTGELVGRYVPAEQGGFRWHDGLAVRAMREGYWLLLDELNLAEPEVVERLDSALERHPSLTLTEHDGEHIAGPGVHPRFRVIATMNPSTHAGRQPLSPALLDRFRAHRRVEEPSLLSVHAFLRYATEGEVPEVELGARRWAGSKLPAPWPELSGHRVVGTFVDALASMHVAYAQALATTKLDRGERPDRLPPTRRTLLSVIELIAQRARRGGPDALRSAMWEAIERYYVQRTHPADRSVLTRQLDAHGLDERMLVLEAMQAAEVA